MNSIDIIYRDDLQFYLDKENFDKLVANNDLIVLKEKVELSLQDCFIDENQIMDAVDFDDILFEKISPYVNDYNKRLQLVDFEKPISTNFYTIFQGFQFIYIENIYDFLFLSDVALENIKTEFYKRIDKTEIAKVREKRELDRVAAIEEIFELMKADSDFCFVCNETDRRMFMKSFLTKPEVNDILRINNIEKDYFLKNELSAKIKKEDIYKNEHYRELRKKRKWID